MDPHQLPPIDEQREEDEDSDTFYLENKIVLEERMRQKKESPIIEVSDIFADNIDNYAKTGNIEAFPLKMKDRIDKFNPILQEGVLFSNTLKETFDMLVNDFKVAYETNNTNYVRALAYRNKNVYGNAPYNISSINVTVRKRLWNTTDEFVINEILVANNQFVEGRDLVLQNGDIGIIKNIKKEIYLDVKCYMLTLRKGDGTTVYNIPVVAKEGRKKYNEIRKLLAANAKSNYRLWKDFYAFQDKFADIAYGYATTSHKAQGSGFNHVYVFEDDIMGVNTISDKEKSQSMYTAITRAIDKLVIYSDKNKLRNNEGKG